MPRPLKTLRRSRRLTHQTRFIDTKRRKTKWAKGSFSSSLPYYYYYYRAVLSPVACTSTDSSSERSQMRMRFDLPRPAATDVPQILPLSATSRYIISQLFPGLRISYPGRITGRKISIHRTLVQRRAITCDEDRLQKNLSLLLRCVRRLGGETFDGNLDSNVWRVFCCWCLRVCTTPPPRFRRCTKGGIGCFIDRCWCRVEPKQVIAMCFDACRRAIGRCREREREKYVAEKKKKKIILETKKSQIQRTDPSSSSPLYIYFFLLSPLLLFYQRE